MNNPPALERLPLRGFSFAISCRRSQAPTPPGSRREYPNTTASGKRQHRPARGTTGTTRPGSAAQRGGIAYRDTLGGRTSRFKRTLFRCYTTLQDGKTGDRGRRTPPQLNDQKTPTVQQKTQHSDRPGVAATPPGRFSAGFLSKFCQNLGKN